MSLLLFLATWGLHAASGLSFLLASALTLPTFSLAWLLLERTPSRPRGEGRGEGAAASGWSTLLARAILELRSETVVFAASAFIGQAVLALLMPAHAPAGSLALPIAAWPFALLCVLAIPLVSALAIAPTVAVLLLAQAIAASGVGAERPLTFAIALTSGWSLAIGVSTVSATLLIASRVSALPAREIALGWNRNFTLLMLPLAMGLVSLLYVLGW